MRDAFANGASRSVDDQSVVDAITYGPRALELFRDVTPVRMWESIEASSNGLTRRLVPPQVADVWDARSPRELTTVVRATYLAALDRAVGKSGRVCVFAGGVDSCGALAGLRELKPATSVFALTLVYDNEQNGDVPYVAELSRALGIEHVVVRARCETPEHALIIDEMPGFVFADAERHALEVAVDNGADVALSATLGDLVFGGDLREFAFRPVLLAMRGLTANVPWHPRVRARARWWIDARFPSVARWRSRPARWARPPLRRRWRECIAPVASSPRERLLNWCHSPDALGTAIYATAIARGLPIRCVDVVADDALLQLMATIPIETLTCDQRYRGLFHRVIEPWVTKPIAERRTKSSLGNDAIAKTPALRDLADARELEARDLVNAADFRSAFDQASSLTPLWPVLSVEAWLRAQ